VLLNIHKQNLDELRRTLPLDKEQSIYGRFAGSAPRGVAVARSLRCVCKTAAAAWVKQKLCTRVVTVCSLAMNAPHVLWMWTSFVGAMPEDLVNLIRASRFAGILSTLQQDCDARWAVPEREQTRSAPTATEFCFLDMPFVPGPQAPRVPLAH
jgi:hypothetical protein